MSLELENEAQFTDLSDRIVEWQSEADAGVIDVDAAPGESGTASFRVPADATTVSVMVRHPLGFDIDEFELARESLASESPSDPPVEAAVVSDDTELALEASGVTLAVDRNSGEVTVTGPAGDPVVEGLPGLVATPQQSDASVPPTYGGTTAHRLHPWRCDDVRVLDDGAGIEIAGGYYYDTIDVATGSFALRLGDDGTVHVEYDFELDETCALRETGVALPVASDCDSLSWTRDSRWEAYPADHIGRPTGTADAFPGGDRPATDAGELDGTRPWASDGTEHGSNDFRSTKRDIRETWLTAADGRGIRVCADGDRHVRCSVEDGAIEHRVLAEERVSVEQFEADAGQ